MSIKLYCNLNVYPQNLAVMKLSKTVFILSTIFIFLFNSTVFAQDPDSGSVKKSYFKFSLSYLTNSVYLGRKDSLAVPYITPEISYHDKSGFYIAGSLSYLAGTGAQVDEGSVTAGFEFNSRNEKFSGDVYAAKYFVSSSSYSVREEVKGAAGGSLDYNTGPITLNSGIDLAFSTKTDVVLDLGLSHQFEFGNNKNWSITPSTFLNAGTQNFYESYFTNRKYSQRRRRRVQNTNPVNVIVKHKSFSVLDYEISLPVDYAAHKWGVFITPTFSIPENGFSYSLNNGATYRSENLSNSFYTEFGVFFKF
jgi:hypothetical protein